MPLKLPTIAVYFASPQKFINLVASTGDSSPFMPKVLNPRQRDSAKRCPTSSPESGLVPSPYTQMIARVERRLANRSQFSSTTLTMALDIPLSKATSGPPPASKRTRTSRLPAIKEGSEERQRLKRRTPKVKTDGGY